MNLSNGRIWPYSIATLIVLVFLFCVATVIVTNSANIQYSDLYMDSYQKIDSSANDIIEAEIAFNRKFKVEYSSDSLSVDSTVLKFTVSDLDSNMVDNAKFKVIMNRPELNVAIDLGEPKVLNGLYTFKSVKLSKEGKWDILVKIDIQDLHRFYNLKADTRTQEIFYGFEKLQIGKKIKKLID